MKIINKLLISCFLLSFSGYTLSSSELITYGFYEAVYEDNHFTILSKIRGTEHYSSKKPSVISSPYEVVIHIKSKTENLPINCSVIFNEVKIKNDDNFITLVKNKIDKFTQVGTPKHFSAIYISDKNLDISHSDTKVYVDYSIINCDEYNKADLLELTNKKEYKEKRFSFWEMLMGI